MHLSIFIDDQRTDVDNNNKYCAQSTKEGKQVSLPTYSRLGHCLAYHLIQRLWSTLYKMLKRHYVCRDDGVMSPDTFGWQQWRSFSTFNICRLDSQIYKPSEQSQSFPCSKLFKMADLLIRNAVVIVIESVEMSSHSMRFHKGICAISHTAVFVPFSLMAFVINFLWAYGIRLRATCLWRDLLSYHMVATWWMPMGWDFFYYGERRV